MQTEGKIQTAEHRRFNWMMRSSRVRIPLKPWIFPGFFFPIAYIGKFSAMITLHIDATMFTFEI